MPRSVAAFASTAAVCGRAGTKSVPAGLRRRRRCFDPVDLVAVLQQPVHDDEASFWAWLKQIARGAAGPVTVAGGARGTRSPSRTDRRSRRGCDRTSRPSDTRASSRRCRTAESAGRPDRRSRSDDPAARTCRARAGGTPAPPSRRSIRPDTSCPATSNAAVARCTVTPVLISVLTNFDRGGEVALIGGQDVAARIAQRRIAQHARRTSSATGVAEAADAHHRRRAAVGRGGASRGALARDRLLHALHAARIHRPRVGAALLDGALAPSDRCCRGTARDGATRRRARPGSRSASTRSTGGSATSAA